jgi:hypothetical protein
MRRSMTWCADGISADASAAAIRSFISGREPAQLPAPASDSAIEPATVKLAARNNTQPTATNIMVTAQPVTFGIGQPSLCQARHAIRPSPCHKPQAT